MALIKCSKCGNEISTNSKSCIHCGASIQVDKDTKVITFDNDTEKNINSLNTLSVILLVIFIIMGIVCLFIGIGMSDDVSTPLFIIFGITSIIIGAIMPMFIKWMALMLKNLYELNRKVG